MEGRHAPRYRDHDHLWPQGLLGEAYCFKGMEKKKWEDGCSSESAKRRGDVLIYLECAPFNDASLRMLCTTYWVYEKPHFYYEDRDYVLGMYR